MRIGINLGDIIIEEDGDVFGEGVNIAARLEQLADPGGIFVSGKVYDEVRDKLAYSFEDIGEQLVKNIARPVRVYALAAASQAGALSDRFRPKLSVSLASTAMVAASRASP
jgi:adenylate cyclase